ncbi:hypothetical protein OKW38_007210 [Paraburkholderia sp. MM5496-R1]
MPSTNDDEVRRRSTDKEWRAAQNHDDEAADDAGHKACEGLNTRCIGNTQAQRQRDKKDNDTRNQVAWER